MGYPSTHVEKVAPMTLSRPWPSRCAPPWILPAVLAIGCGGGEATAPPSPTFGIVAGDRQETSVCAAVPTVPTVRFDQGGKAQPGVPVTFKVTAGGGSVTGGDASTDAAGIATVESWTLGVIPGPNALTATVSSSGHVYSVTFTATGHPEQVLRNVIVYTTEEFGGPDVAIVRPDGSCRRRLTPGDAPYAGPAISPDGRRIAVARYNGAWNSIYLMQADGSGLTKLVGHSDFDGSPAWAPDGRRIAFRSENPGPFGAFGRIYVVNVDGTGLRQVTPDTPDYTYDDGPTWSPDGARIAFSRNGGLQVINADGTGLTTLPEGAEYPAWSPDGAHIAYGTSSGSWPILVVNADGSNPVPLTSDTVPKGMPRWSPDGQRLVFYRVIGTTSQLFTIRVDGSGESKLSNAGVNEDWPRWSPLP